MKHKIVIFILMLGVFSIINTEMGVIGILPLIANHYEITITDAGLLVSLFALAVAFAGPTMPLLFSGMNRKKAMIMVLSIFALCNLISAFAQNFTTALIARVIPAFFHPIYVSLALSVAGSCVEESEAPKAISKVLIGVSAGMVLGVPVVSLIANETSLMMGMLFFALVNVIALIATMLIIPNQPVTQKLTYGEQLSCLKQPLTWQSIFAVIFLNGAIFGVYSYLSELLSTITKLSDHAVSSMLLIYGLANIVGNMIGGRELSKHPIRFVKIFPIILGIVYIALFFMGEWTIPMAILTLVWGILAGVAGNINQYWITSTVINAPEFGNGLFLAATNLGTTIGTTLCVFFIQMIGIESIMLGGILLLIMSSLFILLRIRKVQKSSTISFLQKEPR